VGESPTDLFLLSGGNMTIDEFRNEAYELISILADNPLTQFKAVCARTKELLDNIPEWSDEEVRKSAPCYEPHLSLWKILNCSKDVVICMASKEHIYLKSYDRDSVSYQLPFTIVETGLKAYIDTLIQDSQKKKTSCGTNSELIPHIKVSVKIGDEEVSQQCAQFIDAISFLCHCELCIRRNKKMDEPVDIQTAVIQKQNLKKLLGESN
jgi:hypothetical protein